MFSTPVSLQRPQYPSSTLHGDPHPHRALACFIITAWHPIFWMKKLRLGEITGLS